VLISLPTCPLTCIRNYIKAYFTSDEMAQIANEFLICINESEMQWEIQF